MSLVADIRVTAGALNVDCALRAEPGQLLVLAGPNGAGKTTILRTIAGLLPLASGRLELDGVPLDDPSHNIFLPAEKRPAGIVFQEGLLFPHMTAGENIAFALRCAGHSRASSKQQAAEWLTRIGLGGAGTLRPHQLSGGQARRVALARSLAARPRVLLLDEPLTALDVAARTEMRRELRRQLDDHEGIRILVTHDPREALGMADHIAVVEHGTITQFGTPQEIQARPRTPYIAEFLGLNLLRGQALAGTVRTATATLHVADTVTTGDVTALISPGAIALHRLRPSGSPRNVFEAVVAEILHEGGRARVHLQGRLPLIAEITAAAAADLSLHPADRVWASVKATEIGIEPA